MTPTPRNRSVTVERRRWRRSWAAVAVFVSACALASALRGDSGRSPWYARGTPGAWIGGQPLIPPPHLAPLLPRFFALLHPYIALDVDAKIPFAVWVAGNGVTDPGILRGIMELYVWYQPWLRGSA